MKKILLATMGLMGLFSCDASYENQKVASEKSFVDYVNPLMGTDSRFEFSNGNTYPAVAVPWGMNFWTPQTGKMGDGWAYQYHSDKIRGFKQTHQPSPWINDYGVFSLMAVTGDLKVDENDRASWFSHKAEIAKPDYYSVYLADYDTKVEITPTERSAQFRFTFPKSEKSYVLLDAFFKGSKVKIFPEKRTIIGYSRNNSGGVADNFHNYFVAVFDKDFEVVKTWDKTVSSNLEAEGEHVGAVVGFSTQAGEQVGVKVSSSFISTEQAFVNLEREIGEDTFEQTRQKAHNTWNHYLGRIDVKGSSEQHLQTFYSCLYRVLLFPRKFYEEDKNGNIVHYSPYNGSVLSGYMFTDNGFWDTFRAVFPLFNLVYPDINRLIMKGLVNTYQESGWLPEWASPGHRNCMIGSNSASIIADAYLKGNIDLSDAEILLQAMIKNATQEQERPVSSVGREGLSYYNKLGYIPYDVKINENVARTLEYAYADFCISVMAEKMGKKDVASEYRKKSMNYKNVFDKETGWMRGRNADGTFQTPFNPLKWGDAFTEGNSLHYSWSVFHDFEGLSHLMGGKQKMKEKLDEVFSMPPLFDDSYYGFTIHEIREMQVMNMGNYAHGNQPIQHMAYLYNYVGTPYITQQKVHEIMNKLYAPTPDGYCGDEDNGQTSAWYVFSAMGMYPVTPATDEYVLSSPLFDEVTLHLPNEKVFKIICKNLTNSNIYVDKASLNGKNWDNTYLRFKDIVSGGELDLQMADKPNEQRGTKKENQPYSLSD